MEDKMETVEVNPLIDAIDLRHRHLLLELKQAFINKENGKDYDFAFDSDKLYLKMIEFKIGDLVPASVDDVEVIEKLEQTVEALCKARKTLFNK